jgi:hypothetical protein
VRLTCRCFAVRAGDHPERGLRARAGRGLEERRKVDVDVARLGHRQLAHERRCEERSHEVAQRSCGNLRQELLQVADVAPAVEHHEHRQRVGRQVGRPAAQVLRARVGGREDVVRINRGIQPVIR